MLAFPLRMNSIASTLHAAEIAEVDRVFFFAFFTKHHFVAGDIRKDTLYEIAAIGAGDIPQRQAGRLLSGVVQLFPDLPRKLVFLLIDAHLCHSVSPDLPRPISVVMYSEISRRRSRPNSRSRIRKAAKDAPIALAIS